MKFAKKIDLNVFNLQFSLTLMFIKWKRNQSVKFIKLFLTRIYVNYYIDRNP